MVDHPLLLGQTILWVFAGNYADNFGAVSKGATLTDQCLDGLCESFRRAGLSARGDPRCSFRRDARYEDHPASRCLRLRSALRVLMNLAVSQEGSCS